ncbi:MAG: diguanylate cyclase [Rhodocyclaceae bacterium]|nr:MAG: diguanylate cyclase [Rhodocyclaceae bacterium]
MSKRTVFQGAAPLVTQDSNTSFAIVLMEHLVVPTFVLDADRKVLIWNHACERLTGVPAKDIIGTRDQWRAFYDAPRFCLADFVATGQWEEIEKQYTVFEDPEDPSVGVHAENWCLMPRLGHRLYLAVDAGPIYDDAGALIAVVQTLRDMTDKKHAEDTLQRLASKDFLTSLGNRHTFDEALRFEWRRAQRQQTPISLLMLDADHFKGFNDTYGHVQGDDCLRAIAAVIAENACRAGDLAARYGGEEFTLLLPITDTKGAEAVAERIRAQVQSLAIPHQENPPGCVTISVGCATLIPTADGNAEELVHLADTALYKAKHGGRNRVETN